MTLTLGSGLIAATGALAVAVWYAFAVYLSPGEPLDASETLVVVLICGAVVFSGAKAWSFVTGKVPPVEQSRKKGRRRGKR